MMSLIFIKQCGWILFMLLFFYENQLFALLIFSTKVNKSVSGLGTFQHH